MLLFLFWACRLAAALLPAAFLSGPAPVSVTVAPTRVLLEEQAAAAGVS